MHAALTQYLLYKLQSTPTFLNTNIHTYIIFLWIFSFTHQRGHAGSKTLDQQNPPVLKWTCRLMHVDLYNGCKMVVVVLLYFSF